jgi:phosphoglucomutase
MREHWRRYDRHYCSQHDYEDLDGSVVERLMTELPRELPLLKGCKFDTLVVSLCHDFAYVDPLDKRLAAHQGTRVAFAGDARIVFRLSGTGTESRHGMAVQDAFADLAAATQQIACIKKTAGHQTPSVIT